VKTLRLLSRAIDSRLHGDVRGRWKDELLPLGRALLFES
jgi:hypothetical protein